jgi:hypothetical protein
VKFHERLPNSIFLGRAAQALIAQMELTPVWQPLHLVAFTLDLSVEAHSAPNTVVGDTFIEALLDTFSKP